MQRVPDFFFYLAWSSYIQKSINPWRHISNPRIIDDWGLRYPGVKKVEHVYFYRAAIVDKDTLQGYLERAYELGKDFA